MSDNPLKAIKLFPRNLTARAGTVVRGNPVNTRPESGVENAWPGLEFDHRNLEKMFFPGLVFEYHDERGTILREFTVKGSRLLTQGDIRRGFYLAFVQGRVTESTKGATPEQRVFSFAPPAAMENWRVIRDLEPGPIAVALCDQATYDQVQAGVYGIDAMEELFRRRHNRREAAFVLLFSNRANYLTTDGVIDPVLVPPGNLTRSMCSPWQYDFTDCGCFFWASNKPDLVASQDQPAQILNFQRKNRSRDQERKATDWLLKDDGDWDSEDVLGHVDLITHFDRLKFAVFGRERDDYVPPAEPPIRALSRREIIERLRVLATVEHALAVEYLYAYYSLKLPLGSGPRREPWMEPGRPLEESSTEARIFTAADEILRVAIDEMRHFRWVNEMLLDLGEHWVLDRAAVIGIDFPEQKGFNQPFELAPLTDAQREWFIRVEQASPHHAAPIPGMYTRLLLSIEQGPEFAADPQQRQRLSQFVKMIIDEGVDHCLRFKRVRDALHGIPERDYLRVTAAPKPARAGSAEELLQQTADSSYLVVLQTLDYVFRQDRLHRGELLEAARRAMYNLDAACRALSERKLGALFTLAVPASASLAPAMAATVPPAHTVDEVGEPLRPHLERLRREGMAGLAKKMENKLSELKFALKIASPT